MWVCMCIMHVRVHVHVHVHVHAHADADADADADVLKHLASLTQKLPVDYFNNKGVSTLERYTFCKLFPHNSF